MAQTCVAQLCQTGSFMREKMYEFKPTQFKIYKKNLLRYLQSTLNRPVYLLMGFVPSIPIHSQSEWQQKQLVTIGKIIPFDMLVFNFDRIPSTAFNNDVIITVFARFKKY